MSRFDDLAEAREAEYGYREVSGKEQRLREWAARKEDRDFRRLCDRLYQRKWLRRVMALDASDPRKAKLLARKRAYKARNRDRLHAQQRARRIARRRAVPMLRTCPGCGAQWCRLPGLEGAKRTWCSTACYQADRYKRDAAYRAEMLARASAYYWTKRAPTAATLCACLECGAQWSKLPRVRGAPPKFCSLRCYNAHYYRTGRGLRAAKGAA